MSSRAGSCAAAPAPARYYASPWEQWWTSHIDSRVGTVWHPDGCNALCLGPCTIPSVINNATHPISIWLRVQSEREHAPLSVSTDESHPVLSLHAYTDPCNGRVSMIPIEPLVGALRHPYHDCLKRSSMSASKNYLLPAWRPEVLPSPARTFFFDLGASLWASGSGGASQSWFVHGYAKRGLEFDRILAWEYEQHTEIEIRRSLPAALRNATTIYRTPDAAPPGCAQCASDRLSYHNFGIDAIEGSLRNPLVHLRALVRPDDFVVIKLDVDTPAIELAVVEQILRDPVNTGALIDEFYWEHVVAHTPMEHFGWGHDLRRLPKEKQQTLRDSYSYFTRLREMGIRAHSWV